MNITITVRTQSGADVEISQDRHEITTYSTPHDFDRRLIAETLDAVVERVADAEARADALAAKVAAVEATPTNLREHLSATIRWRLVAANMSQADAAAFVGVSQKHLSQILNGRQDGSLSMWQRLLDFVNTDARAALDASETP